MPETAIRTDLRLGSVVVLVGTVPTGSYRSAGISTGASVALGFFASDYRGDSTWLALSVGGCGLSEVKVIALCEGSDVVSKILAASPSTGRGGMSWPSHSQCSEGKSQKSSSPSHEIPLSWLLLEGQAMDLLSTRQGLLASQRVYCAVDRRADELRGDDLLLRASLGMEVSKHTGRRKGRLSGVAPVVLPPGSGAVSRGVPVKSARDRMAFVGLVGSIGGPYGQ